MLNSYLSKRNIALNRYEICGEKSRRDNDERRRDFYAGPRCQICNGHLKEGQKTCFNCGSVQKGETE